MSDTINSADTEGQQLVQNILDRKAATQQVYHAAPEHPIWDILENIAPHGLAVPGDGDRIARWRNNHA